MSSRRKQTFDIRQEPVRDIPIQNERNIDNFKHSEMSDDEPLSKKSKGMELPPSEMNEDDSNTNEDAASDGEPEEPPPARKKLPPKHITRGKPIMAQAREVIYNVFQYMSEEFDKFKSTPYRKYFSQIQHRTITAAGVSQDTLSRILTQVDQEGKISNPQMPGNFRTPNYTECDMQYFSRVRDAITEIYFENETATLWKLLTKLENSVFKDYLKQILLKMGYVFVKNDDQGPAIVESVRVRLKRINFLEGIKNCRAERRSLVYMTVVSVYAVSEEYKTKLLLSKTKLNLRKKPVPYVIVLIWNADETAPCDFVINKLDPKEFDTWLRTNLVLHLPDDAALIVSSKLNPNKFSKGYPGFTATTTKMQDWLSDNKIPYPDGCLKAQLYEIILKNKDKLPLDNGANFLTDNGHVLLQIPNYHWGLNPLEIIWPKLTLYISVNNPLEIVDGSLMEELTKIPPEEWANAAKQTMRIEETARENDLAMDEISDVLGPHDAEMQTEDESSDVELYE